jgi:hypothetical protein
MCEANSYIEGTIIQAEIDINGYFWLSEGSGQSRYYRKFGSSNRAYPQEACVTCPSATPTPEPTATNTPLPTSTPTVTPNPSSCECYTVYNEGGRDDGAITFTYYRCVDNVLTSLSVGPGSSRAVCVRNGTEIDSDSGLMTSVPCPGPCTTNGDCLEC